MSETVELSLRGGLSKLGGKIGGLFNPALHPRGYHGRFTYTGGHDLKKAEASERKAARHEGHLERIANRHRGGGGGGRLRSPVTRSGVRSPLRLGGRRRGGMFRGGHNMPGHGLGHLLGGHKKQQQKQQGGKGGKGAGKGPQQKKGQQKQPRQQPKGQGKQPKGQQGKNQNKQAAAAAKKLQAAIAKAQRAQAAQQKKQAAAALKAAKAAATAAQKLANAQQKAQLAALKAQATAMMNAARGGRFTPSSHAMLYKGRNAVLKDVQAPAGSTKITLAADSMEKASTHEPVGTKFLWHKPGFHLPDYIEHVANDLIEKRGMGESQAVQMAVGIIRRWASGQPTGGMRKIQPSTVAAASKALAEWESLKARAKSVKSVKGLANATVSGQVLDFTYPGTSTFPGTTTFPSAAPLTAVPVTPVAEYADGPRVTQKSTLSPKRVTPNVKLDPMSRPVEAVTAARWRRYIAQGYTPAAALARVAREAQQRQNEVGLAHQDGSVTVSSSNDGPRVTKSSTSSGPGRAKPKRSWDTRSQRKKWAGQGIALPDGSFPIPSAAFVAKAAKAIGRAPASKRPKVRAHIRRRAKALGVTSPV